MSEGYQNVKEREPFNWVPTICLTLAFIGGMIFQYSYDRPLMDGNRILQDNIRLRNENAMLKSNSTTF